MNSIEALILIPNIQRVYGEFIGVHKPKVNSSIIPSIFLHMLHLFTRNSRILILSFLLLNNVTDDHNNL